VRLYSPTNKSERLQPYESPVFVHHQPMSNGLVRFKTSEKWLPATPSAKKMYQVPYIDQWGFVHATSVLSWYCTPTQLFATILCTINKRLVARTRYIKRKTRPSKDLLFQGALYYCLTNDDSFFKRFHAMLSRKRHTELLKFVYYKINQLDANRRFLYDQVKNNTLWFQLRSRFCVRRVKSKSDDKANTHQRIDIRSSGALWCNRFIHMWGRIFRSPHRESRLLMHSGSLFRTYAYFRG